MFIYYIFSIQGPSQQHIQTRRFYLKKTKNNDAFILRWILSASVGRVLKFLFYFLEAWIWMVIIREHIFKMIWKGNLIAYKI